MNICPKEAITMKQDADGFLFPVINNDLCIDCGMCENVCVFKTVSTTINEPLFTYVAINKNEDILSTSTSGGVFGALASLIFEKKGVVFGCAYNGHMEPEHICVDNIVSMEKIKGSKYVQSNVNSTYIVAKKYLSESKWVLFSGTPCQIAGLKSYLGMNYDKLITVDIICHGVPNASFFKGYIKYLNNRLNGEVIDFKFRDKSQGWGLNGKVVYKKNGKVLDKLIAPNTSYYYDYFCKGDIYRESCYECNYACGKREGDFTMGDYWGIEKVHPGIETEKGVSVLLVNSKKGVALIDDLVKHINLTKSTFEKAREQNGQLNKPTKKSDTREKIFRKWREGGYQAVANEYYESNKKKLMIAKIKKLIPHSARSNIKKILKRG
jgi:coenzyme F420-reducing hydrogenase beta subunit